MAKTKNRKRISVEKIQKKRQNQTEKKLNPFEVHINKEKMRVLGKKLKNEKGLPGVSRAKAIQKRKHTLLNEYKLQHKVNKFMDKRIGERGQVPQEDKIMARFAAVRAKAHNRKSIFNLADDEVLTHRGQTLSEIEKFDDPRSEDEDDDDDDKRKNGRLDANFVEEVHFGGGVLTSTGQEGAKTHKQLIEQLIEESKKRKAEKQKIKEATLELTEKLDTEWKDLVQLVSKKDKKDASEEPKPNLDDYDKVMRELRFEARGTVSDRLKTEDEIAKEEKERLEKLEQERLERMRGFTENNPKSGPNHRSADDLDDDFVIESDVEDNVLTYDEEGKSNVKIRAEINGKSIGDSEEEVEAHVSNNLEESDDEVEEEQEEEEESGSEDSLADLKEGEEDSNSESEPETKEPITKDKIPSKNPEKKDKEISESEKKELEKAGNELPFTFQLPEIYESLMETLQNKSPAHQKIILERMIKCNHPSLSQANKAGLGLLFAYILQYINDLFSDIENAEVCRNNFKLLATLMPHIFDLAQLNKENAHNSILEVIKEKHQEFRKKSKKYPGLEVLVFLKLVSLFFSTSDFRHQIVTPCFMFMEQMLRTCKVKEPKDISYGLFVCTLVLEYTALSKRFLPSTITFLSGILHMAIPKKSVKIIKVVPPFKPLCTDLVLTETYNDSQPPQKFNVANLLEQEFSDNFKVSCLHLTLKLLNEFRENLQELPSNVEIFADVDKYLGQISMEFYPDLVKREYKEFCDSFSKMKSERRLQHLVMEQKKPKALRLYEPKIEEVYDGKRHKMQSKEKAERAKLMHKLKKETKGAIREIRRDKSFLGRVKITQQIQSDKERTEKVKRIYSEAANQQSELNALDRQKKRKK
ncbi:nucleolar protein 14 homolog [Anthonomus grandis grandis]|uniref:nucleolar protein 14 homolog n=1 Tax=Anthonomus grandis grandis TaxID=2921223 RepID=UPI00216572B2|nr:nucleolar protein 14 homolog [Anthonomus grandis grandis]